MPARTGALRGGPLVLLVGAAVLRGLPAARALAAPSPVVGDNSTGPDIPV